MQIEPVVLLRRQGQQRLLERPLHRAQHVAARPLFLGSLLVLDDLREPRFERRELVGQARQRRIVDDAEPRARRQVEIRRIDDPLHVAARPGSARERFQLRHIAEHARARTIQRHRVGRRMGMQVQLGVHLALRRQAPSSSCSSRPSNWRGSTLYSARAVRSTTRIATPEWRMRSRSSEARYHWILSPLKFLMPGRMPRIRTSVPASANSVGAVRDAIARVALLQVHLKGAPVVAGRGQQKLFPQRPEAQQADAEFALQAARALRLELALDGVADVGRHVVEIRLAVGIPAHALAVVLHAQVVLPLLLAPGDDDRLRPRIDAVLDQLGHRLERIALRQGDDRDRIPVIADAQVAARARFGRLFGATGRHGVPADHIRLQRAQSKAAMRRRQTQSRVRLRATRASTSVFPRQKAPLSARAEAR